MGIDDKNLQHVINLTYAVGQRFESINRVAATMQDPTVWRSKDGKIAIGALTPAQYDQLGELLSGFLDDVDHASSVIRQLTASKG